MAKISFVGFWSKKWQAPAPKGFLLLKPKEIYNKNLGKILNKLNEIQIKKEELKELDITIEYHYKKRTLDQNKLMWALYEIEANEMNGGLQGRKDQTVNSMDIYYSDLKTYAPRIEIKVPPVQYDYYKANYRVEKEMPVNDKNGEIKYYNMILIESTSHFNTFQMAKWIDRQFNRMSENGLGCTNPGEIHKYWVEWRQGLNNKKIILHDNIIDKEEYRKLNPICEATGQAIDRGKGHICHIKARGMGGKHEVKKDYASNLLHLCHEAHIEIQHKKGWTHFLKLYPHLKYKIETALRREYPTVNLFENDKQTEMIKNAFDGEEV